MMTRNSLRTITLTILLAFGAGHLQAQSIQDKKLQTQGNGNGSVKGTGTTDRLAKWLGVDEIGDSAVVETAGNVAIVLLASAWLYLGPLLVLAPAELRYLGWTCLASVVAATIVALVPRSFRSRPARLVASTDRTLR